MHGPSRNAESAAGGVLRCRVFVLFIEGFGEGSASRDPQTPWIEP